jgi:hypothetical protein
VKDLSYFIVIAVIDVSFVSSCLLYSVFVFMYVCCCRLGLQLQLGLGTG